VDDSVAEQVFDAAPDTPERILTGRSRTGRALLRCAPVRRTLEHTDSAAASRPLSPSTGGAEKMKMDRYLTPDHPLSRVYRIGAGLFGIGLTVFGSLGFANDLAFFTTSGSPVMGLSSNGLLSTISVVVGVGLVVTAVLGGAIASTATGVVGALFLLSGLANLAVLDTRFNIFAFKIQNVLFSVIVGMLLLFLGLHGRVSRGLPDDNPYVRARRHEPPDADHSAMLAAEQLRLEEIEELSRAEFAVAEGRATPEQEQLVFADALRRSLQRRTEAAERAEHDAAEAAKARKERLEQLEHAVPEQRSTRAHRLFHLRAH
jgi:hypothetical protein